MTNEKQSTYFFTQWTLKELNRYSVHITEASILSVFIKEFPLQLISFSHKNNTDVKINKQVGLVEKQNQIYQIVFIFDLNMLSKF